MSWFVLHPPPTMQIVSFFVTARYNGQDDRAAFLDTALGQLAELLGQPIPAGLTETSRESHLLGLLTQVANERQPWFEHCTAYWRSQARYSFAMAKTASGSICARTSTDVSQ